MATMCFASQEVLQRLGALSMAPLIVLYQHASPRIQVRPQASLLTVLYLTLNQSRVFMSCGCRVHLFSFPLQERACQLTAALAMDFTACTLFVRDGLKGLLELCIPSVRAAVQEQACYAVCRIARPSSGSHACSKLQVLGAPATLLRLIQGMSNCCRLAS